jgi:hypothetical protein
MGKQTEDTEQKPYLSPVITIELELETHAGSPLGIEENNPLPQIP